MNKLLILLALTLCASALYAEAAPSSMPAKHDASLEAKYAAEYEKKVTQETERAKDSLKTLYYGTAAVLIGVIGLGLVVLVATKKQQRAIDMLVTDMDKAS